ncbi:acyltransferase [Candidatus Woesearchaeota archaeon]|nr:acyltransferase [Candidatus Woesearchaeota archaeon]
MVFGKLVRMWKARDWKKAGIKIGKGGYISPKAYIDTPKVVKGLVKIGDNVYITRNVCVLAHDGSTECFKGKGYTMYKKVTIGNNVFIGMNSVVLPGVTIGDNVIIGAGSVVSKDCESDSVYAGVPARKLCTKDEFIAKNSDPKLFPERMRT